MAEQIPHAKLQRAPAVAKAIRAEEKDSPDFPTLTRNKCTVAFSGDGGRAIKDSRVNFLPAVDPAEWLGLARGSKLDDSVRIYRAVGGNVIAATKRWRQWLGWVCIENSPHESDRAKVFKSTGGGQSSLGDKKQGDGTANGPPERAPRGSLYYDGDERVMLRAFHQVMSAMRVLHKDLVEGPKLVDKKSKPKNPNRGKWQILKERPGDGDRDPVEACCLSSRQDARMACMALQNLLDLYRTTQDEESSD